MSTLLSIQKHSYRSVKKIGKLILGLNFLKYKVTHLRSKRFAWDMVFEELNISISKSNLDKLRDESRGQWYGVGSKRKSFKKICFSPPDPMEISPPITIIFRWLFLYSAHHCNLSFF